MAHARNDFLYPILPSMKGLGIYIIVSRNLLDQILLVILMYLNFYVYHL